MSILFFYVFFSNYVENMVTILPGIVKIGGMKTPKWADWAQKGEARLRRIEKERGFCYPVKTREIHCGQD
jgi:hypothetical protein